LSNHVHTELLDALGHAVGPERVTDAPLERRARGRDMGEPPRVLQELLGETAPTLVVRPSDAPTLAAAMELLAEAALPITPRGLGSAGLGGAVPVAGGAVVDLSGLCGLDHVDSTAGLARVRAGTTFYSLARSLAGHGLAMSSRPTNAFGTLGGWAAGGGVGLGSLGAGPLVEQVDAVEVVLADGSREQLRHTDRGFADFFESEGQLGVFASLTLRVRPRAPSTVDAWVFDDLDAALEAIAGLHAAPSPPLSVVGAGHTEELSGFEDGPPGEVVLVEVAGEPLASLGAGVRLPRAAAARLWSRRFFPLDNPLGPVLLASEVLLPVSATAAVVRRSRRLARRHGVPLHVHLHAVGGGAEPTVLALMVFPADPRQLWHHLLLTPLAAALTSLSVRAGGRPYGVGLWNTPLARAAFGAERLEALRIRKTQLDPGRRLNPGKLFAFGTHGGLLPLAMRPALYPATVGVAATTAPLLLRRHDPSALPASTQERCIACGACVPVCLAVAATGDESVSARSKLDLLGRLSRREPIRRPLLRDSLRCVKCGQCEEVCARGLALLDAWDTLEAEVRDRETDVEALELVIRRFADSVDAQRERVIPLVLP